MGAIFLSASVPVPGRGTFHETADVVLIRAAVSALITVALGRRLLVWGGHPAVTPMIWATAEDLKVDYGAAVHLYQSQFFEDDFPEENRNFANVTYVESTANDLTASLQTMRFQMLSSHQFDAAVLIGGMDGVWDEFRLFQTLQPSALVLPIASAGGAALDIYQQTGMGGAECATSLDYIGLFYSKLGIAPDEPRSLCGGHP
ncbi:SLOG domain-containing protein [Azospirillum argentinense]